MTEYEVSVDVPVNPMASYSHKNPRFFVHSGYAGVPRRGCFRMTAVAFPFILGSRRSFGRSSEAFDLLGRHASRSPIAWVAAARTWLLNVIALASLALNGKGNGRQKVLGPTELH